MDDQGAASEKASNLINNLDEISFVVIVLIILVSWVVIAASRYLLPKLAGYVPSRFRLYLLTMVPIIRLLVLVVAVMMIIPIIFNITLQNFFVIAGAVSVAIGFAFKDLATSLIAGVVAVFERTYRPGDWVTVGKDYGEVQTVGLRSIRIRTLADDIVTITHDRIWTENFSNSNDGDGTLLCVADFYLVPLHDAVRVRSVLMDVANTSAYLDYDRSVNVIVSESPWGTHYKVKAYPYDMRDQMQFISDLTVRGKQAIREAGAEQALAPASMDYSERG